MKKLHAYADFDWLKEIELIGELGYESLRGSDSHSFSFHDEWLRKHGDLFLSEDLNNYPGFLRGCARTDCSQYGDREKRGRKPAAGQEMDKPACDAGFFLGGGEAEGECHGGGQNASCRQIPFTQG